MGLKSLLDASFLSVQSFVLLSYLTAVAVTGRRYRLRVMYAGGLGSRLWTESFGQAPGSMSQRRGLDRLLQTDLVF